MAQAGDDLQNFKTWGILAISYIYIRKLMAFRLEHLLGKAAVVENAGALQDGLQDALKETNDVPEKNHQKELVELVAFMIK